MSRDVHLRSTFRVPLPAGEVAAYVLDWGNDPQWRDRVTELACDPPGRAVDGQQQVERLRFWGSEYVTRTEVTDATPSRASYAGGAPPIEVSGTREVRALDDTSCEVRITTRLVLSGTMRLMAPLMVPAYRRGDRRDIERLEQMLRSTVRAD